MTTLLLLSLLALPQNRADWLNWSLGAVDAAETCYNLSAGGREQWDRTQSIPGNAAMILGAKAIETAAEHKCHHKFCRALPWLASLGSAAAIAYSASARAQRCLALPSSTRATYSCR